MINYIFKRLEYKNYSQMISLIEERHQDEMTYFSWMKELNQIQIDQLTNTIKSMFSDHSWVGVGAFDEELLIGYIMGKCELLERKSIVKVTFEGISLKHDVSSEVLRQIYQHVSMLWIEQGCLKHEVYIPLGDHRYLKALQGLSFFEEQAYAINDLSKPLTFDKLHQVNVRIANEKDQKLIESMSDIIFSYQNQSPVYVPAYPEMVKKIREGYRNIVFDKEVTILIAEIDSKPAGFHLYESLQPTWHIPKDTCELTVAATYKHMMGQGIGRSLMIEGYLLMKTKDYRFIHTDWRIANLASSTFWPTCGFVPYMKRMVRIIDQDILWANFSHKDNQR
ncbi:MAG: hypothetical protein A2Y45_07100 [Tenericutes bacterium GWC2_34_14]|nr:MAG: hypothetical protein A2Y45_07100 [Tenericutes bacterium GWC2_34_14]OHE33393.1 MAG: hypothetical protein A2012_10240 [Tenericutes bacterium GWE2_34_108]OHE37033.1 MAG: hypothetical protein A2Y46_08515 [Tenericutes bacterium GWF1_35_14]OHE38254.1 MAG: hypothetical protein A2Y44_10150 [Tenericutes bacterium GWF2_35_184]OHE44961.1 MAG: hypothetical protein A2221_05060 [Tenericutes bacterium RIFOXYA2_FULL_36_32]OHE45429.1 MAG: hypothetical protein A3K26_07700 [Tenericutes bacterium RIFOXYA1